MKSSICNDFSPRLSLKVAPHSRSQSIVKRDEVSIVDIQAALQLTDNNSTFRLLLRYSSIQKLNLKAHYPMIFPIIRN